MRLSARKGDPGYAPHLFPARVLLDGKEIRDCVMADEEACEVEFYVRDSAGKFVLKGDCVESATLRGVVQIIVMQLQP